MSISVCKVFEFEAAHYLPFHEGRCNNLHGHSYKMEVEIEGEIQKNGMIMDFGELKNIVNMSIVERFDHQLINTLLVNPTAENMVENIVLTFKQKLLTTSVSLRRVRLWETSSSYIEWSKE